MVHVNDLPSVFQHCIPFMFADDTKCFRLIKEPNDAYLLQLDLNNLSHGVNPQIYLLTKANLFIYIFGIISLHQMLKATLLTEQR